MDKRSAKCSNDPSVRSGSKGEMLAASRCFPVYRRKRTSDAQAKVFFGSVGDAATKSAMVRISEGIHLRSLRGSVDNFNKSLTFRARSCIGKLVARRGVGMDGIAWTDFDVDEQRTLAMLKGGISTEFCDPVALLTLTRLGLIRFSRLTPAAEQLMSSAIRQAFAA
jgi:hypothetical protein